MQAAEVREDGFGVRRIEQDGDAQRVEVLDLSSLMATPRAEQAIRARALRLGGVDPDVLAEVFCIARVGETLSVTSAAPEGVTLADLLAALEFGTVTLPDEALVELGAVIVRAVAALHDIPGAPAHGALSPSHVLLRRDGTALLSGALFADALQGLQYNREQLWREFGIALPPSASFPRFDQRADVTQLGALVVAILTRRMLTPAEYPKGISDLVVAATERLGPGVPCGAALRGWLQHALQLHAKALFVSAIDASRSYAEVIASVSGRRAGAQALQAAVRQLRGEPEEPPPTHPSAPPPAPSAAPPPAASFRQPPMAPPAARGFAFLRHVFPALRAN